MNSAALAKMSGAGFNSSTSSEDVFRSTNSVMRAMSRYLSLATDGVESLLQLTASL